MGGGGAGAPTRSLTAYMTGCVREFPYEVGGEGKGLTFHGSEGISTAISRLSVEVALMCYMGWLAVHSVLMKKVESGLKREMKE